MARGRRKRSLMELLINQNEALIQKFLHRFMDQAHFHSETLAKDLEQAAHVGFMTACERWDPKRGAFSTICYYWIRHELQVVACGATPIAYPRDIVFARCNQVDKFFAQHGRSPSPGEVEVSRRERMHVQTSEFKYINSNTLDWGTDIRKGPEVPRPDKAGARQDTPDIEGELDERRKRAKLEEFMEKLEPEQRDALLRGDKALLARAQRFFFGACAQ